MSTLFLLCLLLLQRFLRLFLLLFRLLSLCLLFLGMETEIGRTALAVATPGTRLDISLLRHDCETLEWYSLCKRHIQFGCVQIGVVEEVHGRFRLILVFESDKTNLSTYTTICYRWER